MHRHSSLVLITALAFAIGLAACAPAPAPSAKAPEKPAAEKAAQPVEKAAAPATKAVAKGAQSAAIAPPAPAVDGKQPQRGGTLVFGNSKDITTPHPLVATSSIPRYIKESMYEALLNFDMEANLHGALAEGWERSADSTVWTFKLRQGVKFHNGQEMIAEDVVWSANYIMDPNNGAYGQSSLAADIVKAEAVDKHTVRFTMKGPRALFDNSVADISRLLILPANSLQPGEVKLQGAPPAGTGPFKFDEFVPADKTVVSRFDDYWGGAAYVDKIVFQLVARETARGTALRAGDVQLAERIPTDLVLRVKDGSVKGIKLDPATLSGYRVLAFNHQSQWFKDKRMREAVALAIDKEAYMKEVTFGFGRAMEATVPPGSAWEKALDLPLRKPDVNRAKQLMKEAGYNNEPIVFIAERGQGEPIVESLSRMLREAGFNVNVQVLESGVYDGRQEKGDFDLTPAGHTSETEPGLDLQESYRCEEGQLRKSNKLGYCNPALDKLTDQYLAEPDRDKRIKIYAQAMRMAYDDIAEAHLGYQLDRFFAYVDTVHNFQQRGQGGYFHALGGLHRTWMEKK